MNQYLSQTYISALARLFDTARCRFLMIILYLSDRLDWSDRFFLPISKMLQTSVYLVEFSAPEVFFCFVGYYT